MKTTPITTITSIGLLAIMTSCDATSGIDSSASATASATASTPEPSTNAIPGGVTPEASEYEVSARGSMSELAVEITNRRYQSDCFWGGPKGLKYGLLVGALPIQQPGLYPDQGSNYFVGQFKMPAGSSLTITGQYPHLRYFSFTVAHQVGNGQLAGGDFLIDEQITADPESSNPFVVGANRDVTPRNYTLYVVQGDKPGTRAPNTIYTASNSPDAPIHLAMRNYIPDVGYDGTGNAELQQGDVYGLPTVTLNLADGTQQTGQQMCDTLQTTKAAEARAFDPQEWAQLVANSWDPVSAPAEREPMFQRFWNTDYSVEGQFIRNWEERVKQHPATSEGGLANNPDTIYMIGTFSLSFGSVYVIRGKMPTHPNTRHREQTWPSESQVRYWSACTGGSGASGAGWDCAFDEEVPVDENGMYTLVVSWPEDRPKNAIEACGVKWLDFGSGEGRYVGARNWVNTVYMRYMNPDPKWAESPVNIPTPTPAQPLPQDAEVMRDYYPRAKYTSKADFEANHACPKLAD